MAIVYMTEEGYKKMLEEITFLETVKRPEISRQIAEARDKGDLSENAEYDAAKEAQGLLEMKIAQLKDKVANGKRSKFERRKECRKHTDRERITWKKSRRYCRNTSSVRNYDIRNYRYIDLKWNDTSGLMPGRCRSCYTDCPCVHIL